MNQRESSSLLFRAAKVSMILAPLFLLAGDMMQLASPRTIIWTLLLWLAFLFFIIAFIGFIAVIHRDALLWILVGVTVALIGAVAGASMQVLFRVHVLLNTGGYLDAARFLFTQKPLILTTQVPGICFPLGLLILAIGLLRGRGTPAWVALVLGLGAILFPVGHAIGVSWALVGGDILLVIAFFKIASIASLLGQRV